MNMLGEWRSREVQRVKRASNHGVVIFADYTKKGLKMKHRVYLRIEIAIDVDVEKEHQAWRKAQDYLADTMPDELNDSIIDTNVIRIAEID